MTDSTMTAQLRELIARTLPELDDDDPGLGPDAFREQSLRAVELCLTMRSSLREVTQAAVEGARRNGASWAAIGEILGTSRQAAQQMYGSAVADVAPSAVNATSAVRTLYPVTAFDEMGKLAKLGADGWHAIRVGLQSHELVQDTRPWEHVRVLQAGRKSTRLLMEGWTKVPGGAFPWVYLARPVPSQPRDSTRR